MHTHRCSRRSSRSKSWWTNHFSRRILLRFGNVALHGCGHPNSYDYCPPTLTTCLRAAADLFMDNEKLMRRVPSSTGEGPHQLRNFPGVCLGAKKSRDLSRQRGLTIGLGWTIGLQQCLKDLWGHQPEEAINDSTLASVCYTVFIPQP